MSITLNYVEMVDYWSLRYKTSLGQKLFVVGDFEGKQGITLPKELIGVVGKTHLSISMVVRCHRLMHCLQRCPGRHFE